MNGETIVVLAEKMLEDNKVLPKFYEVCLNDGLLVLYENEKNFCLKFRVKTKKALHFEALSDFLIFKSKK